LGFNEFDVSLFFATAAAIASGAETVYKEIIYIIEKTKCFSITII